MSINWLQRVGDWNPQLFREIKGRLQVRNIAIAAASSLLFQLLLLVFWLGNPTLNLDQYASELDSDAVLAWWHNYSLYIFAFLSAIVPFVLLVAGCYLLISDLAREERRGTLNFIRLSPQSARSILIGKMLGVPILLYLAVLLAVPLHLWLGVSAGVSLVAILGFYAVLVASCAFFYSAALLLSLVSSWFSGFQAWLGSGAVLAFLLIGTNKEMHHSPGDWLNLFSPSVVLPYLVHRANSDYYFGYSPQFFFSHVGIDHWEWFNFSIGATFGSVVLFVLVNYTLGTYWIWQSLTRRFHNSNATLISKGQSYLLAACFAEVSLGFTLPPYQEAYTAQWWLDNFLALISLNLLLLVSLIATLCPHRQALQEWMRYRRKKASALIKDLLWGEKSPAIVAIAINLAIISIPMVAWVLFWSVSSEGYNRLQLLSGLVLTLNVVLIYAMLAQLMLLMKSPLRSLWAAGTVVAANLMPPLILSLLSIAPGKGWGSLWLITTSPWDALKETSSGFVLQVILIEWILSGVLGWQLTRQLQRLGELSSQ